MGKLSKSIAKLIKENPGRYEWDELELMRWLNDLPPNPRIQMREAMRQDLDSGYSDVYIFETLHEMRVQMEAKHKVTFSNVVNGIYTFFKVWQDTDADMNRGTAMRNLANLDMDKFGKD